MTRPTRLIRMAPRPQAGGVGYDNDASGLAADTLQEAIDELADLIGTGGDNFLTASDGEGAVISSVAISGSAHTFDLVDGNVLDITLTANCTFTFTGADPGRERRWRVYLRQDATGGRTVTWPGSVVWPDATAPTLSTDPGAVDVIDFSTVDGGTVIFGEFGGSGSGAIALDDLTDVTITTPTLDDDLRYNGSVWVNDARKWEAVTDGEDVFVWESDDLVHEWNA